MVWYNDQSSPTSMLLEDILQQVGLSEKESEIYLALLPRGKAPASLLAKQLNLPRSTVKFTCDLLVQKRLIQETAQGNATFYIPESPDKLLEMLDRKQRMFDDSREELERNMAALTTLYNPQTSLPKVRFYDGKEAFVEMFNELSKIDADRYTFSGGDYMKAILPEAVQNYRQEVYSHDKKVFVMRSPKYKSADAGPHTKYFKALEELKVHFLVTGDVLAIGSINPSAPMGIRIEHPEIAEAFREIFKDMWEQY